MLAELRFGDPAFPEASGGEALAYPIRDEPSAPGNGRAVRFGCYAADGLLIVEGDVGRTGADLILSSTVITPGTELAVTALSYRQA